MEKIQYVTIERSENFEMALTKLRAYLGPLSAYGVYDKIETLMGSARILKLRKKSNISKIAAKVDGPGFIIEKLFEYFSYKETNEH